MNIKQIINEEVDKQIESLNIKQPQELKKILQELFTFSTDNFLKNIGSQETILDEKEALPEENWDFLLKTINESYSESKEDWSKELKKQKLKILCFKYFTKQKLLPLEEIEKGLKLNIKKYFTSLQNFADLDDFREKFFNLPNLILSDFVRYLLFKSKKLDSTLVIKKGDLKKEVQKLKKERDGIFPKVALVSKGYQSVLDLKKIKELFDNGLFFEDNILNRAISEYVYKLISSKSSIENIKNTFNAVFIQDLQAQTESSPAYIQHIDSIKKEKTQPYFTDKGFQIGSRFDNEIELVKNKKYGNDYVVDEDSRFKEPTEKIESSTYPWESEEGEALTDEDGNEEGGGATGGGPSGAGGGGMAPGGGGITFEPPEVDPDALEGGEEGENPEGGESDEMPTGDDGLPVDFGTPETNPEAVEDNKEKK